MDLVLRAIVPIVLLLGLGCLVRHRWVPAPEFWRGLEWWSYRVFTPALFVTSIAATDLGAVAPGPLLLSLSIPVIAASVLVAVLRRPLRADGPQLTSLVQGSIRINTYIGLAFVAALHGPTGVATFALAAAVMVPLVNVISVTTLSRHGVRADGATGHRLWRELVTNPLIQGCAAGLVVNLTGITLPSPIAVGLGMLAAPALVCGTVAAGAAISWRIQWDDLINIGFTSVIKLIALPVAAAGIALALGVSGTTLAAIVIICAVPTAPSAYVLASRMGGDARLMASITGGQTVLALVTLPVMVGVTAGI